MAAFTANPDRLARFEREAKVLAALNHPNIAQVYGFEDNAIAMELVDGPTLADRLAPGPIPVDEALAIAAQIADALDLAHETGIVHRDLKPANIKITSSGTVARGGAGRRIPPRGPSRRAFTGAVAGAIGATALGGARVRRPRCVAGWTEDRARPSRRPRGREASCHRSIDAGAGARRRPVHPRAADLRPAAGAGQSSATL
jgi:serine/threonine-protein kinase